VREAARAVDIFFGAARNQALSSGRPAGVMLERLPTRPEACVTLYQIEEPPPYAGEYVNSRALVQIRGSYLQMWGKLTGTIAPGMVRVGDKVQFNQQGRLYVIDGGQANPDGSIRDPFILRRWALPVMAVSNSNNAIYLYHLRDQDSPTAYAADRWTSTQPLEVSFQIRRQPIRSVAAPLELPAGTAIDLFYSSTPNVSNYRQAVKRTPGDPPDLSPINIVFSPNGSVDRVYQSRVCDNYYNSVRDAAGLPTYTDYTPLTSIQLLVGKRSRILGVAGVGPQESTMIPPPDLRTDGSPKYNADDPDNFWVTINPKSGFTVARDLYAGAAGATAGGR
jgi:hypothetical protein